jgi:SPOR domain
MAKRKDKDESANDQNNNSEDNFGLPDLEYKPLETETTSQPEAESVSEKETVRESYTYTPQEEPKSNAPIIIAVVIGLVLLVGAFLIYQYVYKPKAEKEKRELAEKKKADELARQAEEAERKRLAEEAERKRLEEEAANAKPTVGTFETLTSRTGRYYVVIASAVDGDLISDYARKLSAKGTSSKIIPPFGKWKFYRLTINGDFDSYAAAQTSADSSKPEFGEGAWVIKY